MLLFSADLASAQQPSPSSSGGAYGGITVGLQHNTAPEQATGCPALANHGIFCGDAAGNSPAISATLGVFVARHVGLEVSGVMAKGNTGQGGYDVLAHTERIITTATFEHTADRSLSGLLRLRIRAGRASIEPVAGATIGHSTDNLTDQVRVAVVPGYPTTTTSLPDATTSRTAGGFTFGADIVSPPAHHTSFICGARLRWLNWPASEHYYTPYVSPQPVPIAVGRVSFTVDAGVRWGGR